MMSTWGKGAGSRSGHYIFDLWFLLLSSSFSFLLAYSQRSQSGCLPYVYEWCDLSANLECRSEMCSTWLAGNTGRKNHAKIAICALSHKFVGLNLRNKACIDNRKNLLNMSPTIWWNSAHSGWDRFGSLGTHQISTAFASWLRYCSDVVHRRPTKLCTMFGWLLGWYPYIHFRGLLPPDEISPRATCKIHFAFKLTFRGGLHLYSAGRPSCWAAAHILVVPSTRRITLGDRAFPMQRRESGTQCQQPSERHRRIWRRDLQTFLFKTSFDGWRQWHMHYINAECDYWIILWRAPAAS